MHDIVGAGLISDIREYVFTEWGARRSRNGPGDRFRQRTRKAPGTAKDDLAALRSRFDINGDGKLTGIEILCQFKCFIAAEKAKVEIYQVGNSKDRIGWQRDVLKIGFCIWLVFVVRRLFFYESWVASNYYLAAEAVLWLGPPLAILEYFIRVRRIKRDDKEETDD